MAEKLKTLPGFSQGVRDNSAVRRMILAAPICPFSQVEMQRTSDGRLVPKDRGPLEQNCQKAGPGWWVDCEARGHDPYFTTKVWYTTEDVTDENGIVTGQRRTRHEARQLNTVSVPVTRRHHSGKGVVNSMERKGRRRLEDFGYQEVCQFRNCEKPVSPKARSMAFGNYCSPYHLQLIAADAQGVSLVQLNGITEQGIMERAQQRRAAQLREAGAFAQDG